jgi:hypothetical protein
MNVELTIPRIFLVSIKETVLLYGLRKPTMPRPTGEGGGNREHESIEGLWGGPA